MAASRENSRIITSWESKVYYVLLLDNPCKWTLTKFLEIEIEIESLLSHKINNHISYVTTLKEGIYINYRENQDKNYKTRLCLKTKRLTNVFLNLSVFILGWWLVSFLRLYLVNFFFGIIALKGCIVLLKTFLKIRVSCWRTETEEPVRSILSLLSWA